MNNGQRGKLQCEKTFNVVPVKELQMKQNIIFIKSA